MPKLVFLGTASAVPDENHENTYMAVLGRQQTILIDCSNNAFVRLEQAGIHYGDISDVILTHFHPDHVSGLPSLLLDMWLMGRKTPLKIYGLAYTLERMEKLMEAYDWDSWPGFFPVTFHPVAAEELAPVLESGEFKVTASPVHHLIPNIGLRVDCLESGKSFAYSCDTEPCAEVVRLAQGVDVLVHECGGPSIGHTSPDKAGETASRAEAGSLFLIHYKTRGVDVPGMALAASQTYSGLVTIAEDFMKLDL
jgi:ribonuclease Z